MRDNRYTNMWNETPEEQEKRRQYLSDVYDASVRRNEEQTSVPGNGSQADCNHTAEPVGKDNAVSSVAQNDNLNSEPGWLDKAAYGANGALQGLSFGFADEIEGVMSGLGYGLASLNSNWNKRGESFGEAFKRGYTRTRDMRRNQLQEGYEKAPILTRTMEAIGATVSPLNKIGRVSNFAPRTVQAAQGMTKSVAGGTAYGLGAGEGDMSEQAKNMVLGGVTGWAGNKVNRFAQPATSSLFMNQTSRNLAGNFIENASAQGMQNINKEMEDYWKRRRF